MSKMSSWSLRRILQHHELLGHREALAKGTDAEHAEPESIAVQHTGGAAHSVKREGSIAGLGGDSGVGVAAKHVSNTVLSSLALNFMS